MASDIELSKDSGFILFLRGANIKYTKQIHIAKSILHGRCPCCFVEERKIDGQNKIYRGYFTQHWENGTFLQSWNNYPYIDVEEQVRIFNDHFQTYHYQDGKHLNMTEPEKLTLGILQQLMIYAVNTGRGRSRGNVERYGSAIIKLEKEFQIPQLVLAELLNSSFQKLGEAAYRAMVQNGLPDWVKKVTSNTNDL